MTNNVKHSESSLILPINEINESINFSYGNGTEEPVWTRGIPNAKEWHHTFVDLYLSSETQVIVKFDSDLSQYQVVKF